MKMLRYKREDKKDRKDLFDMFQESYYIILYVYLGVDQGNL